jgi:hypothetical protein
VAEAEAGLLEQQESPEDQGVEHGGGREQERTLVTGRNRHASDDAACGGSAPPSKW